MDPEEVQYLGENQLVTIIPAFNSPQIHLIAGDFGPFKASLPVNVPLWVALNLKRQKKCRIQQPDWMDAEKLEIMKQDEKNSRVLIRMPSEFYMVQAKLLLGCAEDDISNSNEIRTIIKDIWDIRMSKLRSSVDLLIREKGNYAAIDNITMMELNSVRPLFPHGLDQIYRLKSVTAQSTGADSQNPSFTSASRSSSNINF